MLCVRHNYYLGLTWLSVLCVLFDKPYSMGPIEPTDRGDDDRVKGTDGYDRMRLIMIYRNEKLFYSCLSNVRIVMV